MDDWAPLLEPDESPSPISEEFDPSWPYSFKWGVSAEGRTDVWRTKGGMDGMPTHRGELTRLWGRTPQIREGDQMGMAQYIPAEMKLDGSLVAPPVVLVHPYYGLPVPPSVIEWFERQFPNTVVRQAAATNDMKGRPIKLAWAPSFTHEEVKWAWNEHDGLLIWITDPNGYPHHDENMDPSDYTGQANILEDGAYIQVTAYKFNTPPKALADVKAKLGEMFPNAEIDMPDTRSDHEALGVEFHGDPGKLARRMSAAEWAQKTFEVLSYDPLGGSEKPQEATERKPRPPAPAVPLAPMYRKQGAFELPGKFTLSRFFTDVVKKAQTVKKADADMDGAMIALFIPEVQGKRLKVKGGEPLENLHITLVYFQDKYADRDDWHEVQRIVEQVARQTPPMTGTISGYGVFSNEQDVLWASPSIQGLAELRSKLFNACEDAGFPVSKTHDWAPHITLKYDHKGKLPKVDGEIKLDIPELTFAQGNKRDDYKLEGHFEKEAGWGAQDWDGWGGTYLFATDGKEVHTVPWEGGTPPSTVGVDFKTLYPESDKPLVHGFAIPTADGMGYGITAPLAGWGHPDEPGLHEIISALDKKLEKPTHFIESPEAARDPERYTMFQDWSKGAA